MFTLPGTPVPTDNVVFNGTATQASSALSTLGGTSDGRLIADICDEVVELGPVNATIHQLNERVAIGDLEPLSLIYRRILEQLLT